MTYRGVGVEAVGVVGVDDPRPPQPNEQRRSGNQRDPGWMGSDSMGRLPDGGVQGMKTSWIRDLFAASWRSQKSRTSPAPLLDFTPGCRTSRHGKITGLGLPTI